MHARFTTTTTTTTTTSAIHFIFPFIFKVGNPGEV